MIDLASMNIGAIFPAASLALGACILLVVDLFIPQERKDWTAILALVGIGVSFVAALARLNLNEMAFDGMYVADSFTSISALIALSAAFLTVLLGHDYLKRTGINRAEFYPLMLFTTSGAMFMAASGNLVVLLIGLELLSIPLYVMAGFRRNNLQSEEAAMKYFLLGAFASGFLVFGIALIYGATGSTDLEHIFRAVADGSLRQPFMLLVGAGLVVVAMGFKVAVVPFHMWTPDVYQGAPTPITAFMSVVAKLGGFAALMRVLTIGLPIFAVPAVATLEPGQTLMVRAAWQDVVVLLSILTMILANVVAVMQRDIKRLLAYSSIAHAGYVMMAVAAAGSFVATADDFGNVSYSFQLAENALRGLLIYLLAYAFTNLGAFAVAVAVERDDATGTAVADFAGLGRSHPALAGAMTVFMLSLTGIPLTGGFVGKWFVFLSAVDAGLVALVLVGVLTSVISAFYYLRVIVTMWFNVGEGIAHTQRPLMWAVGICTVITVALGVAPMLATAVVEPVALALAH
ncbi:MAG: NADH-quinone oxidoreductase subunit N [Anaerolineae bacterium]|nr:NADH-quinone oxidoreductase subunit N [Anaerolineae bacterium]